MLLDDGVWVSSSGFIRFPIPVSRASTFSSKKAVEVTLLVYGIIVESMKTRSNVSKLLSHRIWLCCWFSQCCRIVHCFPGIQRLESFRWGFVGTMDIVLEAAIACPLVLVGGEVSIGVCFDFCARGIWGT